MGDYSLETISSLAVRCQDQTLSTTARGRAFEELFCYLLGEIPGIVYETDRVNFAQSDEIDIAIANRGNISGLACFPTLFLVEAKNWTEPVDSNSLGAFIDKLRDRHIELGILVAANGVTGDPATLRAAHHKAASAQTSGFRILLITMVDLLRLRTSNEFTTLLRQALAGPSSGRHLPADRPARPKVLRIDGIRTRCAVLAGQQSVGSRLRALVRSSSVGRV